MISALIKSGISGGVVNSLFRVGVWNARDMERLYFMVLRLAVGDHRWVGFFVHFEGGLHRRVDP